MEIPLNILMLGARGCGKSTLLASMYYGLRDLHSEQLSLKIDDAVESAEMLTRKERLLNVFARREGNTWTEPENNALQAKYHSIIEVTISKHLTFKMNVLEVPGSEFQDKITEETVATIRQTQVFIIVIDTPWLMERGRKGVRHNDVQIISDLLIQVFSENEKNEDKLLLFIPMKCEKYYNAGRIGEVNCQIKEVYANLVDHLKRFERTTVFITPVLTLGNLEFSDFVQDNNNQFFAEYTYTGAQNYKPRFAEQPFIYVMDYLLKTLNKNKEIAQPSIGKKIANRLKALGKAIIQPFS